MSLYLSIKLGEDEEKTKELVEKLLTYDPDSERLTLVEARELGERSGMIIVLGWDIERAFVLYHNRRQDKAISYEAYRNNGL